MGLTTAEALQLLKASASTVERAKLARYGIPDDGAIGVAMRDIISLGRKIGTDHALAKGLWASGLYEARSLAAFVADPRAISPNEMDAWAAEFDNWAICDTVCFRLFDRTPHAWEKVRQWCPDDRTYVRRAGLALISGLTVHDKTADDDTFLDALQLVADAANDDREQVRKGASMALRATGKRNDVLRSAAIEIAQRLAASDVSPAARTGREALRDIGS